VEALACLEEGQRQLKNSKELAIRQRRKEKMLEPFEPPYLNKKDWVVYDSVLGVCSLEEAEQYDKRELDSGEQDQRVRTHQTFHGTTASTTIPRLTEFCDFIILLCLFLPDLTRFSDFAGVKAFLRFCKNFYIGHDRE